MQSLIRKLNPFAFDVFAKCKVHYFPNNILHTILYLKVMYLSVHMNNVLHMLIPYNGTKITVKKQINIEHTHNVNI